MTDIPRDGSADATLALLSKGYDFISDRCDRLGSDIFRTRLMLSPVVCLRGPEAARFFYRGDAFTRRGAMPPTTLALLQGKGSVQSLDDAPHAHRKAMFVELMSRKRSEALADLMEETWRRRAAGWPERGRFSLLDEVQAILTEVVCRWAGLSLSERELEARGTELSAMIDGAGAVGPRMARAMWLRKRCERWARGLIAGVRFGEVRPPKDAPLMVVALHRDLEGELLSEDVAAKELLNLLRPVVAVARFIVHEQQALERRTETAAPLDDEVAKLAFAQEVRRLAPFFPFIGGRARRDLDFQGHRISEGDWVLLDLRGTLLHRDAWRRPERFDPSRFHPRDEWDRTAGHPDALVPQGAGDEGEGHRCPGEPATLALMRRAIGLLEAFPVQSAGREELSLSRMPAMPEHWGMVSARAPEPSATPAGSPA